jgi:hypothetical protein
MRTHKCMLSVFTLGTAIVFGAAAFGADLPKEGTFSGTSSAAGTYKAYPVGKDRILVTYDENGLFVGNGAFDHTTYHCFGLADIVSGMEQDQGYCVLTDPAGDQVVINAVSDGKRPTGTKSFGVSGTFTSGTGKYTGITGEYTGVMHGPEFRTAAEGTFVQYGENQGKYKLP